MLNHKRVTGNDIEKNEKVFYTLKIKENFSCEEELITILKRLKHNKALGADSLVNEFPHYGK